MMVHEPLQSQSEIQLKILKRLMLYVYVTDRLKVQYENNLHECVLKNQLFKTHKCKLIPYWTSKRYDYMLIIYWKKF